MSDRKIIRRALISVYDKSRLEEIGKALSAAGIQIVSTFKVINSHPALLPNFPGAHAVRDALAAKVAATGTTIHWVDAGMDTGKVIAQREVPVLEGDTEALLHERIKIVERGLIVATISDLLASMENNHE